MLHGVLYFMVRYRLNNSEMNPSPSISVTCVIYLHLRLAFPNSLFPLVPPIRSLCVAQR